MDSIASAATPTDYFESEICKFLADSVWNLSSTHFDIYLEGVQEFHIFRIEILKYKIFTDFYFTHCSCIDHISFIL
jgi:hypothetical protein